MAGITSCVLPQYLWYNKSIQMDKASVHFLKFSKKVSIMFCKFLVTVVPLKNGISSRRNTTYMKVHILDSYNW